MSINVVDTPINRTKPGVYLIKNIMTNEIYVGSTVHMSNRFRFHRGQLRHNVHDNPRLQKSFNEYGEDNFEFVPLFNCNESTILEYEQQVMDELCPEFNIHLVVDVRSFAEEQVLEIRSKYRAGECNYEAIGDEYGMSASSALRILAGKTYQHLLSSKELVEYQKRYENSIPRGRLRSPTLTTVEVQQIRENPKKLSQYKLSKLYSVAEATITKVLFRRSPYDYD